jgi:hypothetical protein
VIEEAIMTMKHISPYLMAVATAVALSPGVGYAQNSQHEHAAAPAAQGASVDHQAMMANMQAEQKKLDELVAQMNAATGPEKVDRIAAVITEMAAMHKRMSTMMMQGGMMQMQHGATPGEPPKAAPEDHADHH